MTTDDSITSKKLFELGFKEYVIYPGECYLERGRISFEVDTHCDADDPDIFETVVIDRHHSQRFVRTMQELKAILVEFDNNPS
jgi:hypothetical protein